jgi:tRNA threonylcarbamoyladenosine biosynthesis protein TsaB
MGSIALGNGGEVLARRSLSAGMKHAGELHTAMQDALAEVGWPAFSLNEIHVSIGPGSFTGLRIGVTVARTFAWTNTARIVAVPTLDALACNALAVDPPPPNVAVVLDAKRSQIYTALYQYEKGGYIRTQDACLANPADFLKNSPHPLAVLGEGIDYHRPTIDTASVRVLDRELWPGRADSVYAVGLQLAERKIFTDGGDLLPLYIRRPEAEEKWEQLHPESKGR